jgi:hypothetical protein
MAPESVNTVKKKNKEKGQWQTLIKKKHAGEKEMGRLISNGIAFLFSSFTA